MKPFVVAGAVLVALGSGEKLDAQYFLRQQWREVALSSQGTTQQEPTASPALKTLVATLGRELLGQNDEGEVESVNLYSTEITDAGLAHLTGLPVMEKLGLSGTGVTDAGLAHLAGLTKLKILNLPNSYIGQVTEAGIIELRKALPNCRISLDVVF